MSDTVEALHALLASIARELIVHEEAIHEADHGCWELLAPQHPQLPMSCLSLGPWEAITGL